MIPSGNILFIWEVSLMGWLQSHIGSAGISFISFFSLFGEELPLILIIGFMYWSYDKKLGRTMGLSALMGMTWNTMIKNIFQRRRPYFDHKNIKILRVVEPKADIYDITAQGYSFPSGHSTNVVTVFGSLATNLRKRWVTVVAIVIVLLTGMSRTVVGAHYPTDVLAGWLLGFISVFLVHMLQKRVKNTLKLYGILLVTAVPGFFFCTSADYFTVMSLLIGFMGARFWTIVAYTLKTRVSPCDGRSFAWRTGGLSFGEYRAQDAFLHGISVRGQHRCTNGAVRTLCHRLLCGLRYLSHAVQA